MDWLEWEMGVTIINLNKVMFWRRCLILARDVRYKLKGKKDNSLIPVIYPNKGGLN